MGDVVTALLSGVVVALTSWFPVSPEEGLARLCGPSSPSFLVPAYLGVMFSVFYRHREGLSKGTLLVLRDIQASELWYFLIGLLLTILIGFPLAEYGIQTFGIFNLLLAALITVSGLTWPKFAFLRNLKEGLAFKPSFLDAVLAGLFQGFSSSGWASRTGLVTFALILPGHEAEEVLEWGFLIAPAYHLVRLLHLSYSGGVSLGFMSAATAFFVSLGVMELLVRCAKHLGTKKFLTLFGLTGVLINLGVMV